MEPLPSRGPTARWDHVVAAHLVPESPRRSASIRESEDDLRVTVSRELREALGQLPRLQRLVLLADLAAEGKAPARELAAKLGTSANSIYVTRSNARRALLTMLRHVGRMP
jgi:DNA-directed RNA polymerase specialized sigma24 family protein